MWNKCRTHNLIDYISFVTTLLIKNKAGQRTVLERPGATPWPTKMTLPLNSQFLWVEVDLCIQLEATKFTVAAVREP